MAPVAAYSRLKSPSIHGELDKFVRCFPELSGRCLTYDSTVLPVSAGR